MAYGDSDRPEVSALVPSAHRVLDVGCFRGAFGAVLASRGCEVWGIEPDPEASAVASGRLSKVIEGCYPEDMPESEMFDCIVFNDVLEHMDDPASALTATRSYLASGGCIVASIPNIRHITVLIQLALMGRWDYTDDGILDRTHLRFFTKATMRELFEANGYRVDLQHPINLRPAKGKFLALRLLPVRIREELLARQYVVIAR